MNIKSSINYRSIEKYKYQLMQTYKIMTDIRGVNCSTRYLSVDQAGKLTIKVGYSWDGPSGPTVDTKNFMRGSLVHDALYQLMRDAKINIKHRNYVDRLLQQLCKEDGMSSFRAWYIYKSVALMGAKNARPSSRITEPKIQVAP